MSKVEITKIGDWNKAKQLLEALPMNTAKAVNRATLQEGLYLASEIIKRIDNQVPPPNAASTIFNKGSSKTLVDKGDMRKSVHAEMTGAGEVFVGAKRTTRGADLVRVHEEGRVIIQQMTEKQRRFLHARMAQSGQKSVGPGPGTGIIVIHIPPRPFIGPVFEAEKGRIPDRFLERLAHELAAMGTPIGTP